MKNIVIGIAAVIAIVVIGFFFLNSYIYSVSITPAAQTKSGISGRVLLGPTCPVMRDPPDPQCADKLYETSLVVTTVGGAQVVKQFSSNASGAFVVDVPPGEYEVRSTAATNIHPYCRSSGTIKVDQGVFTDATIYCDTGIR